MSSINTKTNTLSISFIRKNVLKLFFHVRCAITTGALDPLKCRDNKCTNANTTSNCGKRKCRVKKKDRV